MEFSESITTPPSNVQSIPQVDPNDLLAFTQDLNDDFNLSDFHQDDEVPLQTTNFFYNDNNIENATNIKTEPYSPEFKLSFPSGTPDPTLTKNSQKRNAIDLTTKFTEHKFKKPALPRPEEAPLDKPLDLTVSTFKFSNNELEKFVLDDFDLEFVPDPMSSSRFTSSTKENPPQPPPPDDDPYLIGPSTSRKAAEARFVQKPTFQTSSFVSSIPRLTPMDILTLNYSQTSLEDNNGPIASTPIDSQSPQNAYRDKTSIPKSVENLYDTIKVAYSDFAFVYSLASQMCQDRVPMECFVHLKIGLLLSIASMEENPSHPPMSVVAIGPEFTMANLLMEKIGDVAARFVGPHDDYKVQKDRKDKHIWIEADSVVLARGGIYYLGDWGRLKAANSEKHFKIIESGLVPLECTSITCPLEAAIWTHWRSYENSHKEQQTLSKFIEIFGIPLIVEEENHEVLIDLLFEQASSKPYVSTIDELSICPDDMREFMSVVSNRSVYISDEASEILKNYFISARIERQTKNRLSQRSFTTLMHFAKSFAKLSLRHEVILIDAIAAIYMTELTVQELFGPGLYPPPKFKIHTNIADVDKHLAIFHNWVNCYISKFMGEPK